MNKENCLSCILKAIVAIQNNASRVDCNDNSCTRPFLGEIGNIICFNTRLVTLYRCDNTLVTLPYTLNGETSETTVFRIESVNDNSTTVLLLADDGSGNYVNTNTYATINLGCICAIRCIGDTTIIGV